MLPKMIIPPIKEEGTYTYYLRMGGRLHLFTSPYKSKICLNRFKIFSLLTNKCKNPTVFMPCNLCMFRFMISFILCFMMS